MSAKKNIDANKEKRSGLQQQRRKERKDEILAKRRAQGDQGTANGGASPSFSHDEAVSHAAATLNRVDASYQQHHPNEFILSGAYPEFPPPLHDDDDDDLLDAMLG